MADNLKKLAQSESFLSLQDKVCFWANDYQTNSCDQNLNCCIELIEQVAKVQARLFAILTSTAQEGGHNEGVETIKSRLLPLLQTSFSSLGVGKIVHSEIRPIQDFQLRSKNRQSSLDQEQQQSDGDSFIESQPTQVQDDLTESGKNLEGTKNGSAISLLAAEEEINQLKKQLKSLQAQEDARHKTSENRRAEVSRTDRKPSGKRNSERPQDVVSNYEKHLKTLKDEIAVLSAEKSGLQARSDKPLGTFDFVSF